MRPSTPTLLVLLAAGTVNAASSSSWSFIEASVSVTPKDGNGVSEKFTSNKSLPSPLLLGPDSTLQLQLTTTESGRANKPHQAFLLLQEPAMGLEAPFPLKVKGSGKAVVDISHKDLPVQLLLSSSFLRATIVVGSFGSAVGIVAAAFDIRIELDPATTQPKYHPITHYGKRPEIDHIFRADPRSPPAVISLFFSGVVLATLPMLFQAWRSLGANINDMATAFGAAPIAHLSFLGSIVALEAVFFMYYTHWNLLQTLPALAVAAVVAIISGSRALGEVQGRRTATEVK